MHFCRVSPDAVHILRLRRHLGLADHLPRLHFTWELSIWYPAGHEKSPTDLYFIFIVFILFCCFFCFCFCFLFVCLFVRYIRMLRLSLSKILRTYEEHTQTERYFAFFFFGVNSNWKYNKNVELWSNSTINPNTTNTKIIFFNIKNAVSHCTIHWRTIQFVVYWSLLNGFIEILYHTT